MILWDDHDLSAVGSGALPRYKIDIVYHFESFVF